MAPLLLELSSLEAESLEMTVNTPKQERSLDTLVESEVVALLSGNGTLPLNSNSGCCCCCAPSVLCCCCSE